VLLLLLLLPLPLLRLPALVYVCLAGSRAQMER
jgi:hypothetical protein